MPLLSVALAFSTVAACVTVFTRSPQKMVLGWLIMGLLQSAFLLLIGFELLALLNAFFSVGSATVLHLYSTLFGTRELREAENVPGRKGWIQGWGAALTLGAILAFASPEPRLWIDTESELPVSHFTRFLVNGFPELPGLLGFILFLFLVAGATIGRPAWKRARKGGA